MRKGAEYSTIAAQKLTRLKVNKVAIIQSLKVEHVLSYLVNAGVLTKAEEEQIESCSSSQDKTRKLLELLPTHGDEIDWYGHFRFSLRNPEVRSNEIKRRYQILVEFLDNTIIHPPTTRVTSNVDRKVTQKAKLPRYAPLPNIDDSGSESASPTKTHPGSRVTFNLADTPAEESGTETGGDSRSGYYTVKVRSS